MVNRKSLIDLLKMIYAVGVAVLYPYVENTLGKLSARTFDLRWQYIAIGLLFFYALAIIVAVTVKRKWHLILGLFSFLVLVYLRYRYVHILTRIDMLFVFVLLILILREIYKMCRKKIKSSGKSEIFADKDTKVFCREVNKE